LWEVMLEVAEEGLLSELVDYFLIPVNSWLPL